MSKYPFRYDTPIYVCTNCISLEYIQTYLCQTGHFPANADPKEHFCDNFQIKKDNSLYMGDGDCTTCTNSNIDHLPSICLYCKEKKEKVMIGGCCSKYNHQYQ